MEKSRLVEKKEEIVTYQRRLKTYAKEKKTFPAILWDGIVTLLAAISIFFEEIYKFFRYRFALGKTYRFLAQDVSWMRVLVHFTLAFALPVVIFSISVTAQDGNFWINFYTKLSQGILFSTTVSLASTILADYLESFQVVDRGNQQKEIRFTASTVTVWGILLSMIFLMIASFFYAQSGQATIKGIGLFLQFVLYIAALLVYGARGRELEKVSGKWKPKTDPEVRKKIVLKREEGDSDEV